MLRRLGCVLSRYIVQSIRGDGRGVQLQVRRKVYRHSLSGLIHRAANQYQKPAPCDKSLSPPLYIGQHRSKQKRRERQHKHDEEQQETTEVDKRKRIIYYPAPHDGRTVFRACGLMPHTLNSVDRTGAKLWVIPWVGKSICNNFFKIYFLKFFYKLPCS